MDQIPLEGGFIEPALQSADSFRAILEAMARPGRIQNVSAATPPAPVSPAAGSVLLTLCDGDTPVYLAGDADTEDVRAWIAFHTAAPISSPETATFALGTWHALQPLDRFPPGRTDYPDRSATLIVEMSELSPYGTTLSGPGIEAEESLSLPETQAFQSNSARFPLGLDFIFTCGGRLAALPRTTKVAAPDRAPELR